MKPAGFGSLLLWAAVSAAAQSSPPQDPAPLYVESSIVNAANSKVEGLAPNTLATVYGQFLSRATRAISDDEIVAGVLPTALRGTGVRVMLGGVLAQIIYVSPAQINFLVPSILLPGNTELRVSIDSRYGPAARVRIAAVAPALFGLDPEFAVATRNDGTVVTRDSPAHPGELVVLYATGLGATTPKIISGQLAQAAARVSTANGAFRVLLDGTDVSPERILYAGLAPGFAGLYQVNLKLPSALNGNPEIRIGFADILSPAGLKLYVQEPAEPHIRLH